MADGFAIANLLKEFLPKRQAPKKSNTAPTVVSSKPSNAPAVLPRVVPLSSSAPVPEPSQVAAKTRAVRRSGSQILSILRTNAASKTANTRATNPAATTSPIESPNGKCSFMLPDASGDSLDDIINEYGSAASAVAASAARAAINKAGTGPPRFKPNMRFLTNMVGQTMSHNKRALEKETAMLQGAWKGFAYTDDDIEVVDSRSSSSSSSSSSSGGVSDPSRSSVQSSTPVGQTGEVWKCEQQTSGSDQKASSPMLAAVTPPEISQANSSAPKWQPPSLVAKRKAAALQKSSDDNVAAPSAARVLPQAVAPCSNAAVTGQEATPAVPVPGKRKVRKICRTTPGSTLSRRSSPALPTATVAACGASTVLENTATSSTPAGAKGQREMSIQPALAVSKPGNVLSGLAPDEEAAVAALESEVAAKGEVTEDS
eukprot:CAMPEP_0175138570 /NCGR_PEP_ID=MMETSP0087-20121206/10425_1 /TAXON_ID=136419 /ORGANISM="Unknown Unknown, Strain D1" /LENGTH=428 /DNA_ID=CAMNT_0016421493 /DNA_START=60 /DNA_END=1346 /DNA_ORIENTATION=+